MVGFVVLAFVGAANSQKYGLTLWKLTKTINVVITDIDTARQDTIVSILGLRRVERFLHVFASVFATVTVTLELTLHITISVTPILMLALGLALTLTPKTHNKTP